MTKKYDFIGYLAILILAIVYSWMTARDNHPFNDVDYVQVEQS